MKTAGVLLLLLAACFLFPSSAYAQRIASSSPANGASNVPVEGAAGFGPSITINFDTDMDFGTLPGNTLFESRTGTPVAVQVNVLGARQVELLPPVLKNGTTYLVNLTGLQSANARPLLPPTTFSFTTRSSLPNISVRVSPDTIGAAPDQRVRVTYTFYETNKAPATIINSVGIYETTSGQQKGNTINMPVRVDIPGGGVATYAGEISVPPSVVAATGPSLVFRRIFTARDQAGGLHDINIAVRVNITSNLTATFTITEIIVDVPTADTIIKQGGAVRAHAFIRGTGTGTMFGSWFVDDIPVETFTRQMVNGITVEVESNLGEIARTYGGHRLSLRLTAPTFIESREIPYIVSASATGAPILISPPEGASIEKSASPPTFSWSPLPQALGYQIAFMEDEKSIDTAKWRRSPGTSYAMPESEWAELREGTYYWAVRAVQVDGRPGRTSEIRGFRVCPKKVTGDAFDSPGSIEGSGRLNYAGGDDWAKGTAVPVHTGWSNRSRLPSFGPAAEGTECPQGGEGESGRQSNLTLNGNVASSERLAAWETIGEIPTATTGLSLDQPFSGQRLNFTGNWSTSPFSRPVSMSSFTAAVGSDRAFVTHGDLAFNQSEFSLFSMNRRGTSLTARLGNSTVVLDKVSDSGRSASGGSGTGLISDITGISLTPFRSADGSDDGVKLVYLSGTENPEPGLDGSVFNTPRRGSTMAISGKASFFNRTCSLQGEVASGEIDGDTNDTTPAKRDNASNFRFAGRLGRLELGAGWRSVGTHYATLGNPYLTADQKVLDYLAGLDFGAVKAQYSQSATSNNVSDTLYIPARSAVKTFTLNICPGNSLALNFVHTANDVSSDGTTDYAATNTTTATTNYSLSYSRSRLTGNFSYSDYRMDDRNDLTHDSLQKSYNLGLSYSFGPRWVVSATVGRNETQDLVSSLISTGTNLYFQSEYFLVPEKASLNLLYSTMGYVTSDGYLNNGTDNLILRLNWSIGRLPLGLGENILTAEYNFTGYRDYVNGSLNTADRKFLILFNNNWRF
jgi:hypothetical protein